MSHHRDNKKIGRTLSMTAKGAIAAVQLRASVLSTTKAESVFESQPRLVLFRKVNQERIRTSTPEHAATCDTRSPTSYLDKSHVTCVHRKWNSKSANLLSAERVEHSEGLLVEFDRSLR